jgi:hypothetical protein
MRGGSERLVLSCTVFVERAYFTTFHPVENMGNVDRMDISVEVMIMSKQCYQRSIAVETGSVMEGTLSGRRVSNG